MKRGQVEDRKIMDVTGHKKIETLSHYNAEISSYDRRTASGAISNTAVAKGKTHVPMVSNLEMPVELLVGATPNILLENIPDGLNRFDKLSLQFFKFGTIRGIQVILSQIFIETEMF